MNSEHAHKELLALLSQAWGDIEKTKQRQWRDIYQVMLGQVAITGLLLAWRGQAVPPCWLSYILLGTITLLTVVGIAIVNSSQKALSQQRKLVDEYYKLLENEKLRALLEGPIGQSVDRLTYPRLYIAMVIGSGILAFALIIGRQ